MGKHRCASEPYGSAKPNNDSRNHGLLHAKSIMNRDMVYHFKAKDRRKRRLLGRNKWVGNHVLEEGEGPALQRVTVLQEDKLCRGEQIKVSHFLSHQIFIV